MRAISALLPFEISTDPEENVTFAVRMIAHYEKRGEVIWSASEDASWFYRRMSRGENWHLQNADYVSSTFDFTDRDANDRAAHRAESTGAWFIAQMFAFAADVYLKKRGK